MKKVKSFHSLISLQDLMLMLIGVITAGFALEGFLVPNNFFDGGVSGMSLLIHEIYHLPLPAGTGSSQPAVYHYGRLCYKQGVCYKNIRVRGVAGGVFCLFSLS